VLGEEYICGYCETTKLYLELGKNKQNNLMETNANTKGNLEYLKMAIQISRRKLYFLVLRKCACCLKGKMVSIGFKFIKLTIITRSTYKCEMGEAFLSKTEKLE
jgi:hypothetical protein